MRRGYDAISLAYRDDDGRSNAGTDEDTDRYGDWLDELASLLTPGSRVLDLGCGAGVPAARHLAIAGFEVTGVDISSVQIQRARRLVPAATFVEADMVDWDAEPGSLDAVVSLYALIHVPLKDQQTLFHRVRRWLRQDGFLLAIVGHRRWSGVANYLGAPMYWDHADTATYLGLLAGAGLIPVWDRFIPEGDVGHTLVLAQAQQDSLDPPPQSRPGL